MTRLRSLAVALATVVALSMAGAGTASAQPAIASGLTPPPCALLYICFYTPHNMANCPLGNVCLYPRISFSDVPQRYYYYGTYNLQNQYGWHLVYNNQYLDGGYPTIRFYTGYNATGNLKEWFFYPGDYGYVDLTPINSITVSRY